MHYKCYRAVLLLQHGDQTFSHGGKGGNQPCCIQWHGLQSLVGWSQMLCLQFRLGLSIGDAQSMPSESQELGDHAQSKQNQQLKHKGSSCKSVSICPSLVGNMETNFGQEVNYINHIQPLAHSKSQAVQPHKILLQPNVKGNTITPTPQVMRSFRHSLHIMILIFEISA